MPYNLLGGRPKSMKQGIYWVQKVRAADRRRARTDLAAGKFNERYNRINEHFVQLLKRYATGDLEIQVQSGSRLHKSLVGSIEKRAWIDANIHEATSADLSQLVTTIKNTFIEFAKRERQLYRWDAPLKLLLIDGETFDFS